jgi:hypothetical protein
MSFFESRSSTGVVGYNWLDDEVHPNRAAQFELATELARKIIDGDLLKGLDFAADLQRLPSIDSYNEWTGFDTKTDGYLAYLKAAQNALAFGRFAQRLTWDPMPERFLQPALSNLEFANDHAPTDQSRYLTVAFKMAMDHPATAKEIIELLGCRTSSVRSREVYWGTMDNAWRLFSNRRQETIDELVSLLNSAGCAQ